MVGGPPRRRSESPTGLKKSRAGLANCAQGWSSIRGHQELLASVRQAAVTHDGALLFVNSGLDPSRPLDTQRDAFWWGADQLAELTPPYAEYKKIIRGFDPYQGGVSLDDYVATVDGGAGFGGTLTAACFDSEGRALDRIDA